MRKPSSGTRVVKSEMCSDPITPYVRLAEAILYRASVDAATGDAEGMQFLEKMGNSVAEAVDRFNVRAGRDIGTINIRHIINTIRKENKNAEQKI